MNEKEISVVSSAEQSAAGASFSASKREIIAAILMYFAAYFYHDRLMFYGDFLENLPWVPVFTILLVGMTELLHWEKIRPRESWIWLGCLAAIETALLLGRGEVWDDWSKFFIHVCFIWWVLCRSGVLLEGETGRMLPLDVLFGYLINPFRYFFLRIRCLLYGVKQLRKGKRRVSTETLLWTFLAAITAFFLFFFAFHLLSNADVHFHRSLSKILKRLTFQSDGLEAFLIRFAFSLPIAAWLFGLIAGTGREDRAELNARRNGVQSFLDSLRRVPAVVWIILTSGFCALYALFFVMHTPYLLGAFRHTLPFGFTVARYARQGFFELCGVMAVNFALLWLVTRVSKQSVRESFGLKISCLVLLTESLLFAVIAASKLYLYIRSFGFSPLRLQSAWLIASLAFGCGCAAWSILRQTKTIRTWVVFSAVTLSLLHFI